MARRRHAEDNSVHTNISFSQVDFWLLLCVVLLLGIGTMMIFSASTAQSYVKTSTSTAYDVLKQQFIYALTGIALMFIFSFIDYKLIARFSIVAFLGSMGLLALVFSPLGRTYNNARRWLRLGIEFQPSELLKLALVLFMAYVLSNPRIREKTISLWGILIYALPVALSCVMLALQPHISCVVIIGSILIAMMFAGKVKWPTFAVGILVVVLLAGGVLLYAKSNKNVSFNYILNRFKAHQTVSQTTESGNSEDVTQDPNATAAPASTPTPSTDNEADKYQQTQSLYAIGSGGLFGKGFGKSAQKYLYLPEPYNDFIFSILAEELGFVGVLLVLILFTVLIMRGYKVSGKAPDLYGSLVVFGIITNVGIQVVLNLMVVSGMMPVTGISLPFFSYGGTSLWIMMISMGIVLNVSKQSRYSKF